MISRGRRQRRCARASASPRPLKLWSHSHRLGGQISTEIRNGHARARVLDRMRPPCTGEKPFFCFNSFLLLQLARSLPLLQLIGKDTCECRIARSNANSYHSWRPARKRFLQPFRGRQPADPQPARGRRLIRSRRTTSCRCCLRTVDATIPPSCRQPGGDSLCGRSPQAGRLTSRRGS